MIKPKSKPVQPELILTGLNGRDSSNSSAFLLTNRNNLQEILSSGIIWPASWYRNYYQDLGAHCREAIPLLLRDVSPELVALVSDPEPTAFPVILEINLSGISGSGLLITQEWNCKKIQLPMTENGECLVLSRLIPADRIQKIFFRDLGELKEFKLRKFSNVPEALIEYSVADRHFQGHFEDVGKLLDILKQISDQIPTVDMKLPVIVDSLAGLFSMLFSYSERDIRLSLKPMAYGLQLLLDPESDCKKIWEKNKPTSDNAWFDTIPNILPVDFPDQMLIDTAYRLFDADLTNSQMVDYLFGMNILQKLSTIFSRDFSYDSIIDDSFSAFIRNIETLSDRLNAGNLSSSRLQFLSNVAGLYKDLIVSVKDVNSGVIDLDAHLKTFPAGQFPVSTALLLFTLRSKINQVFNWLKDRREFPPEILAICAAFAGTLYGAASIPVEFRPGLKGEQFIRDLLINYINQRSGEIRTCDLEESKIKVLPQQRGQKTVEVLFWENQPLMNRDATLVDDIFQPATEPKSALRSKIPSRRYPKSKSVVEDIPPQHEFPSEISIESSSVSQKISSTSKIETLRALIKTADYSRADSKGSMLAVEFCREAGWSEFIVTVIALEGVEFLLEYRKGRNELRIPGIIKPVFRLHKTDDFLKRFLAMNPEEIVRLCTPKIIEILASN